MRRVLHVPASDVRIGDLISFRGHLVPNTLSGEAKVVGMQFDPSDSEFYLEFDPHHYNAYFGPADQLILILEV